MDVDNNGDPNDEKAMWTPGEIFIDRENDIRVSVDVATSSGFQVTISTNPSTFTACIEFIPQLRHVTGPGRATASVQFEAASDCHWLATSNSPWITVTASDSGSGNGSVNYSVAPNPNPNTRTGTLTIDDRTFTVTQFGTNTYVALEDDMENDISGWEGKNFSLDSTTNASGGVTHAWVDSNYQNRIGEAALFSPVIDLTWVNSAILTFRHRFDFAPGGWWGRVSVYSPGSERPLKSFTGTQTVWRQELIDLTPYVGQSIPTCFPNILSRLRYRRWLVY